MDDPPIPPWQKLAAGGYLLAWIIVVALWHGRFAADFFPPDSSRIAPNIIASAIIMSVAGIVAILIWPPTRRRLHRFVDRKLEPVHAHLTAIRAHHVAHESALQEIQASMVALHTKHDALAKAVQPKSTRQRSST